MGIFLFDTASRPVLGPTQPPIQWVAGTHFLGVTRPVREVDHSPPSSAEVKECVKLYLHFSDTPLWRGAQLKTKAQGQLYLLPSPYKSTYIASNGRMILNNTLGRILKKSVVASSKVLRQDAWRG
jgi:hypothetical protein